MTSKKQSETFDKALEEPITGSVFDFLYHDGRRVASFLAQFDPSGSLTQVSQSTAAEKARHDSHKMEAGGSVAVAKGTVTNGGEVRHRRQDEIMRVYDPMWSNARALLDLLDENEMIQRSLSDATLGQIVLISGSLDVYDLQIMSGFWSMPTVKKLIAAGLPEKSSLSPAKRGTAAGKRIAADQASAATGARQAVDLFMDMAPSLPHSAYATITTSDHDHVWCSVDASGLSMTTSDILLKHGIAIPGEWSILGILDAEPGPVEQRVRSQSPDGSELVAKVFETLVPVVRNFLGRPPASYGMTPLLIFREASAPQR